MNPARSSQTLMCIGPVDIAFARPQIVTEFGRLDSRIDVPVDSVTKERLARAARTAGYSTTTAFVRAKFSEIASTVPSIEELHPGLIGRNK